MSRMGWESVVTSYRVLKLGWQGKETNKQTNSRDREALSSDVLPSYDDIFSIKPPASM